MSRKGNDLQDSTNFITIGSIGLFGAGVVKELFTVSSDVAITFLALGGCLLILTGLGVLIIEKFKKTEDTLIELLKWAYGAGIILLAIGFIWTFFLI